VQFTDNGLILVSIHQYTDPTTKESVSLLNNYVMLSDLFSAGWAALVFASLRPGDTVSVHGAGPVGVLAAYSAICEVHRASSVWIMSERDCGLPSPFEPSRSTAATQIPWI
jgi:hypothetical protein